MPNWIPILIVLLTHGAGGTAATSHPHDLSRMLRMVVLWEDSAAEAQSAIVAAENIGSAKTRTARIGLPAELVSATFIQYWPASDLSRDGPSA